MRKLLRAAVAVAALAATVVGVQTAQAGTDPVAVAGYDLGDTAFTDPVDWPDGASELRAVVHYPRRSSGALPVVVLLHGQQLSCYSTDEADWGSWPCPAGVPPYPSHRGYDYLGRALARDGFAVVSLSASGLNHHMGVAQQRARLVNRHLELLKEITTSGGVPVTDLATGRPADLRGRLDLTRVGTMGHSVGGEGVMHQAADSQRGAVPAGVRIRGVVSLASPGPSGFYDTRVTTAPIAVVSAGCWGLGSEEYTQAEGVHGFRTRVVKGNHNFYNTEWTTGPGPTDGDDTECPEQTGRPTAEQHRSLAVTYLRAFYGYALNGDRSGLPVLTGARPFPGVATETVTF
ncbi:hypothetical protein [Catenuloplanes atrovinosus]|uniref:Dienelactone hydrolase n=1 Tax=Catenuloplanes atrovinosus TaxID=137266 RepID=A0AAE3YS07_9ACTN|nr:hypothetical protein [Catenuloplanes atrovinosus]MDR7277576.1 dienelactone hydrolase [Catenuloplanes atrovinosus]